MKTFRHSSGVGHVAMALALVATCCWAMTARAPGVTRIEVKSRTDVLNGKSWGDAGPYERITGTVYFTVDPNNPHNKMVPLIDKAPRDANGMVEFFFGHLHFGAQGPKQGQRRRLSLRYRTAAAAA